MRQDREKWDLRYGSGERPHDGPPSQFLRRWLPYLPRGRALDVATGLGRNAMLLAEAGHRVDAVDISPVGLQVAKTRAARRRLRVRWIDVLLEECRVG
jgi:2-polyprenyl-3-methyl-5-hydroxy-6-metoxy-1,4-benzoquinol methylase